LNLKDRSELTAIDLVTALSGLFLLIAPWLVGLGDAQTASWNAWVCGLAIGALAIAALNELYEWNEWADLALGLWTAIAPWVLGLAGIAAAMRTHMIVDLAVAALAASELWFLCSNPPATTA
jgi:hypothetical protein